MPRYSSCVGMLQGSVVQAQIQLADRQRHSWFSDCRLRSASRLANCGAWCSTATSPPPVIAALQRTNHRAKRDFLPGRVHRERRVHAAANAFQKLVGLNLRPIFAGLVNAIGFPGRAPRRLWVPILSGVAPTFAVAFAPIRSLAMIGAVQALFGLIAAPPARGARWPSLQPPSPSIASAIASRLRLSLGSEHADIKRRQRCGSNSPRGRFAARYVRQDSSVIRDESERCLR